MFEMFVPSKAFILVLIFSVALLPEDTEAIPPFFRVFVALGYKLAKNSWYARCNPRLYPPSIKCPSVVYGVGLSSNQAKDAARVYANTVGDNGCGKYVGHCEAHKFIK